MQHHLLLPGKLERLGLKELPRPSAIAPDSGASAERTTQNFPLISLPTRENCRCLNCRRQFSIGPGSQPASQPHPGGVMPRLPGDAGDAGGAHPGLAPTAGPIAAAPQGRGCLSSTARPSCEMVGHAVGKMQGSVEDAPARCQTLSVTASAQRSRGFTSPLIGLQGVCVISACFSNYHRDPASEVAAIFFKLILGN